MPERRAVRLDDAHMDLAFLVSYLSGLSGLSHGCHSVDLEMDEWAAFFHAGEVLARNALAALEGKERRAILPPDH